MAEEDEIQRFKARFLNLLTERCLEECGRAISPLHYPVFKRFVNEKTKKELNLYRLRLTMDYEEINKFRKERTYILLDLYLKLFSV